MNQRSHLRLHLKVLTTPNVPIDTMVTSMREVYSSVGIRVDHVSTETLNLAANPALQLLNIVDVGECVRGQTTQEQRDLFANRNNVGTNDVTVPRDWRRTLCRADAGERVVYASGG